MTESTFGTILNHKGWSQSMLLKMPGFFAVELRLSQLRARSVRSIICSVRQNCAGAINLYILLRDFLILPHKHAYQQTDRREMDRSKRSYTDSKQSQCAQTDRQTDRQTGQPFNQTDRYPGQPANQPVSKTDRQANRQTDRQPDRYPGQPANQPVSKTDRQANRQTDRQPDRPASQPARPASQSARPTRQPASRQIIRQKADSRSSMSFSDLCQKRAIV